ncbi:MAG: hypothetical protein RDV48_30675 [Candidatus Eremiobacteraeota bacterium]|nr:hypothetical protein [Candidatus Eremiobacteraeota bacterium]
MKKVRTRNELAAIINRVPEEKIPLVADILELLITDAERREDYTLLEPMEDESLLRPEFVEELKESEEAARTGNVMTLEAFLKEQAR